MKYWQPLMNYFRVGTKRGLPNLNSLLDSLLDFGLPLDPLLDPHMNPTPVLLFFLFKSAV